MDSLKKYIKEHEEQLNIEQADDNVWNNVNAALKTTLKQNSALNQKYDLFGWLRSYRISYRRLALALVIPVLFIISCTYRIKQVEQLGSIITLNVETVNTAMIEKINSLEYLRDLHLRQAQNVQPQLISFVGFVQPKASSKINALKTTLGEAEPNRQFAVIPVERTTSESLFSLVMYNVFNRHVDLKQTGAEEIGKNISKQLKNKGITNISIQVSEIRNKVVINLQSRPPVEQSSTIPADEVQDSVRRNEIPSSVDIIRKQISPVDLPKKENHLLKPFAWVLHTWRTVDSSQNTYHKWIKISDTLYMSFLLRLEPDSKIVPGFYLHVKDGSTILRKDNRSWLLTESGGNKFLFQGESQLFPHQVLWVLSDKRWRFDRIQGSLKDQVFLYIDDSRNRQLDSILNNHIKRTR